MLVTFSKVVGEVWIIEGVQHAAMFDPLGVSKVKMREPFPRTISFLQTTYLQNFHVIYPGLLLSYLPREMQVSFQALR